jgi:hypothetical protein
MSQPPKAQLYFGYLFDKEYVFPWSDEKYGYYIETWWKDIRGFNNIIECPFTESGDYKPGINFNSPQVTEYWREETEWMKNNPIPVKLINYCANTDPLYILATKEGYYSEPYNPEKIQPEELLDTDSDFQTLASFMETYNITPQGECGWFLATYWND